MVWKMRIDELPLEVFEHVLSYLNGIDILKISWCNHLLRSIATNEQIWIKCALREYNIDLRNDASKDTSQNAHICTSARVFTVKILMPIGTCLQNMWQLYNFEHFGGLAKLLYHHWSIYLVNFDPPKHPHTENRLQPEILCRMYLNDQLQILSETFIANQKNSIVPQSLLETIDNGQTLKLYCSPVEPIHAEPLIELFQKRLGIHFIEMAAERMDCRVRLLNSGEQLFKPLETNSAIPAFCPLRPGLFKGTYGSHGIEIINVMYENEMKIITGRKVTGDPNIPFGKISFQASLDKPMFLTKEEQRSLDLIKSYMAENNTCDDDLTQNKPSLNPFEPPYNCRIEPSLDRDIFQTEMWRFQATCQVAFHGYDNPRFIDGNLIVFSENTFGVIYIDLQCLAVFDRIEEELSKTHFSDVMQMSPQHVLGKY